VGSGASALRPKPKSPGGPPTFSEDAISLSPRILLLLCNRLLVIESIMVSPWLLISGPETSVFPSSLSSASSSFWPQPISASTFARMMTVILGEVQEGQSRAPGMGKAQHTKKSLACNYCRLKKVKCES
jgi:hypothetical protein